MVAMQIEWAKENRFEAEEIEGEPPQQSSDLQVQETAGAEGFLERWEDDLGHPRARVREERAAEGDEMELASAFSGTPVRTAEECRDPGRRRWGAGVAWGRALGPATPAERPRWNATSPSVSIPILAWHRVRTSSFLSRRLLPPKKKGLILSP